MVLVFVSLFSILVVIGPIHVCEFIQELKQKKITGIYHYIPIR